MSHADKSALYQELKAAGVKFEKQYRQYTTVELQAAVDKLHEIQENYHQPEQVNQPELEADDDDAEITWDDYQAMLGTDEITLPENYPLPEEPPIDPEQLVQFPSAEEMQRRQQELAEAAARDAQAKQEYAAAAAEREQLPPPAYEPDTDAGIRMNTTGGQEILGVDENGFAWYQYEVRKPAFPQPRKRRVLRYIDTGTKVQTVQNGQYIETFEVAGDDHREAEARITLPSYQVGVYKDPRFPFKIHVYNENRGFDFFEVQDFYGGADLVPIEIKRIYVENVLCYDIRTTVRAIEAEARRLDLTRGTA